MNDQYDEVSQDQGYLNTMLDNEHGITESAHLLFRRQANKTGERIQRKVLAVQYFGLVDKVIIIVLITVLLTIYMLSAQRWHRDVTAYGTIRFASTPLLIYVDKSSPNSALKIEAKLGQQISLGDVIAEQVNILPGKVPDWSKASLKTRSPVDGTVVNVEVPGSLGWKSEPLIVIKPVSDNIEAEFALSEELAEHVTLHQIIDLFTQDMLPMYKLSGQVTRIWAEKNLDAKNVSSHTSTHVLIAVKHANDNSYKTLRNLEGRRVKIRLKDELFSLVSVLRLSKTKTTDFPN